MNQNDTVRVPFTREQFEWLRSLVNDALVDASVELGEVERVHGSSRARFAVLQVARLRDAFELVQSVDDVLCDVNDSLHGDSGVDPI